ncbi:MULTISPECIES: hypothetical protein [Rhodococcus]|nr:MULTISPECIES: hypothetical protein [Rhodococcus]MDV7245221.1 hypothetical protein [Rhodococcus oxybenzonivorans]MDV7272499.1 hypothetical protein [Rhodococcus oxybenzonivorans]MDV7336246.1 hypothetical protein [Rhodococcus oxybenzonivorans]MDV7342931.1 hypothetical protein [Rhodococcus oxybenzonivorans]MDV8025505.1 hypothetical protein [Rhodococcus sp. IEGM 27]
MRELLGLWVAVVLAVSACSPEQTSEPPVSSPSVGGTPYAIPDNTDYNYRWSADPGIDLLTPEATAVRAYVESYYLTVRAIATSAGYPGFEEAVDERLRMDYDNLDQLDRSHYVGTQFQHLLWMTPTERGWFATVCTGDYSVMSEGPDGRFFNVGSTNLHAETVEIAAPDFRGINAHVALPAEGPERAPAVDVFRGWKLIDHVKSARNQDAFLQCRSRMPDPPQNRPLKRGLPHDTPYPTLAPYPGWPRYDES